MALGEGRGREAGGREGVGGLWAWSEGMARRGEGEGTRRGVKLN